MSGSDSQSQHDSSIADQAALWVIRSERGLSAEEQDALSQWLGEDSRHRAAFADQRWNWEELDRLAGLQSSIAAVPDRSLLAPPRRGRTWWFRWTALPIAAAAVVALLLIPWRGSPVLSPPPAPVADLLAPCEQRRLEDGSVIELNRAAAVTVTFSAGERHVRLDRGEAHFDVAHDPLRPFVVEAAGIQVQAVGTEFSVALEPDTVAVLVTQGKVRLNSGETSPVTGRAETPIVAAGQRAVVSRRAPEPAPQIAPISDREIEQRLAWKPRLLEFNESTLAEIAAEFNRHNPVKIVLGDAALAARRLSGTLRSDNLQAFVHLLETDFCVRATRSDADEIVLRQK